MKDHHGYWLEVDGDKINLVASKRVIATLANGDDYLGNRWSKDKWKRVDEIRSALSQASRRVVIK